LIFESERSTEDFIEACKGEVEKILKDHRHVLFSVSAELSKKRKRPA